jgi:NADH-quinone oxidoreductase subunit M
MITGLFKQSIWFAIFGGMTLVLGAIYMLYAYQRVMLGDLRTGFEKITDIRLLDYLILVPLILVILVIGIYPQPIFHIAEASINIMQNFLIPVGDNISAIVH